MSESVFVIVDAQLADGSRLREGREVAEDVARTLNAQDECGARLRRDFMAEMLVDAGRGESATETTQIVRWKIEIAGAPGFMQIPMKDLPRWAWSKRGRVQSSRSLLRIASRVISEAQRRDAIDEWIDEIETAALAGQPVMRRTFSILLRALPIAAIRAQLPSRVRRPKEG